MVSYLLILVRISSGRKTKDSTCCQECGETKPCSVLRETDCMVTVESTTESSQKVKQNYHMTQQRYC